MFQLTPQEVHSWCARLDIPPQTTERLYATLSPAERQRSMRFCFEQDRRHFVAAHGILRDLLGRYLHTRPERIRYVRNAFGRPELDSEFGGGLRFSLSHSGCLALIAIAPDVEVGIDVESIRDQSDYEEIARTFFTVAEADQLASIPPPLYAAAFLGCWTKKEACVKALGRGLSTPLDSFVVPLTSHPARNPLFVHIGSNDSNSATHWSLYTLRPAPGYIGALAIKKKSWRLLAYEWHDDANLNTNNEPECNFRMNLKYSRRCNVSYQPCPIICLREIQKATMPTAPPMH